MNRRTRHWWNLISAAKLFLYWLAVFLVISGVSVIVLHLANAPDILITAVNGVLIIGFYLKVGVSWWRNLPLTEEEIEALRTSDKSITSSGAYGYCYRCQRSVGEHRVDENDRCIECGQEVETEVRDDDWLWWY